MKTLMLDPNRHALLATELEVVTGWEPATDSEVLTESEGVTVLEEVTEDLDTD